MREPAEYARYREDERLLTAIGRHLRDAPDAADLPSNLADAALAAWSRDEADGPALHGTDEQRRVRQAAGTLALVGLAVERARQQGSELALHPETVAEAVAADDH